MYVGQIEEYADRTHFLEPVHVRFKKREKLNQANQTVLS